MENNTVYLIYVYIVYYILSNLLKSCQNKQPVSITIAHKNYVDNDLHELEACV